MADITNNVSKKHKISLVQSEFLEITQVINVISCDGNTVVLKLSNNVLTLKGEKFNIAMLNLEEGEAKIEGVLFSMSYGKTKEKLSLIKKVFK